MERKTLGKKMSEDAGTPTSINPVKVPIHFVELQEFLFSGTAANFAHFSLVLGLNPQERQEKIRDHIRGAMRLHRFVLLNWLMQNGVEIPLELMDDRLHLDVGAQSVDQS